MMFHSVGYLGFGSYVPERVVTNDDLQRIVDTSDEWIRDRTGISERRIMADSETILEMSVTAAKRALENAGREPKDIGVIRVAVNTWMRFPSLATQLQAELGVDCGSASDVSAGCAGFIYGVEDAFNKVYVEKALYDQDVTALVVGVDALSLITDWTDRNTCVLLGDGAGAVVLGASEGNEILATHTDAQGKYGHLLCSDELLEHQVAAGSGPVSFTHETKTNRPYLHMDGRKVFPVAVRSMARDVHEVLKKFNGTHPDEQLAISDIDYVYPHQANMRIISSVADTLGVPLSQVYCEGIKKYGNTSAASIPIGYDETKEQMKAGLIVDVAFGAGFASGAVLRRVRAA